MAALGAGKLDPSLLAQLLGRYATPDPRLVVPPRVGEDAAAIELPDRYLVVSSDPVTLVAEDLGYYVVMINANDVATLGARPRFFSCVLLFPAEQANAEEVERVFAEIQAACAEQQVSWIGGHTELTPAVAAPLAVGHMLGEVARPQLVRKTEMQPGDRLLLTKALAVEGVSIIARQRSAEIRAAHGAAFWQRVRGFLRQPGIGIVKEALLAQALGGVRAMHDPTEGGLAEGLHELAAATPHGLCVRREAIPLYPETECLCAQFGLDPLGLIASGSLLLVVEHRCSAAIAEALRQAGVACCEIGEIVERAGCHFSDGSPVPRFPADEITKLR